MVQSAAADPIPYPTTPATSVNIHWPLTLAMVRQLAAANPAHNPMAAANTRLGRESSNLRGTMGIVNSLFGPIDGSGTTFRSTRDKRGSTSQ